MTEFKPLAYTASVVVLLLVVAFAAAMQWNPALRAKALGAGWLLGMAGLWTLGKMLGAGAWIGSKIAWGVYALANLWAPRIAKFPRAWRESLHIYCTRRAFHRPQHAA